MAIYRHLVKLPQITGIPEDTVTNVWHSINPDDTGAHNFATALVTFYQAVDTHMSVLLNALAGACSIVTYDLGDPTPRAPVDTVTFQLTPNTQTLPPEVAICLSFQGARVSGETQARRRGRVYIGPLNQAAQTAASGRPVTLLRTDLAAAASTLIGLSSATYGDWAVYSPTNDEAVPVTNGWIDDEFDTVRSRGRRATVRSTFT